MTSSASRSSDTCLEVLDIPRRHFLEDLVRGMSLAQKSIPSKYFYDERGSRLFDQITALPEYYPTRTELGILSENSHSIAECLGSGVVLIEYGSGSSVKTRVLLDRLDSKSSYVPVDISGDYLRRIARELSRDYPHLKVVPVHADYSLPVVLPATEGRKVIFYPGSTIGNFEPEDARRFLERMRVVVEDDGGVLIGIDLQKNTGVLEAAYNDSSGVTAEFNKNVLRRANNELGANFDLDLFRHRALYNSREGRIEMHLVSVAAQVVHVDERSFPIAEGEYIHTENSYKYEVGQFSSLAMDAGFSVQQTWMDEMGWFCLAFLTSKTL